MSAADGVRLTLMAWFSPAFPVGAFAYSHGLESVHAAGELGGSEPLSDWIDALLEHGTIRNDAVLLAVTWRAAKDGCTDELWNINELAVALAASNERRLETTAQGWAFARAVTLSWPVPLLDQWFSPFRSIALAYPVAVALAANAHGLPLAATLEAYLFAAVGNLVSAATRLGAIGQSDAQRVVARFAVRLPVHARRAAEATIDDLGGCALRAELFAFRHETQYTRLFRT